jgi:DNA-binding MarR family transcriptional regulator
VKTQDIRVLRILEKVNDESLSSQRDLARELNISLGLANSFIKRLAHKGYVKTKTIPSKRIRYIITPQGLVEKSRLTYRYIQFSYQYYRQARQKLKDLFAALEQSGVRRVVFYGATDLAEIAYLSLQETAIELAAVADDRPNGQKLMGRAVIDILELADLSFDGMIVTKDSPRGPIEERILSAGVSRDKIVFIE